MEEIIFEYYSKTLNSKSVEEVRDIAVTALYIAIKYVEIVKEFQVALKDQVN